MWFCLLLQLLLALKRRSSRNASMADKKRKERDDGNRRRKKLKGKANVPRKKTGPHLPSSLKKEIERLNPTPAYDSDDSNEHVGDVYEFEEQQPEEESRKNKRYDPVSVNDDLSSDFEVSLLIPFVLMLRILFQRFEYLVVNSFSELCF